MKILGIDYGETRTGLSTSDLTQTIAGNPHVICERNLQNLIEKLCTYISENQICEIVIGYPKNMNGTIGEKAKTCEFIAKSIKEKTGLNTVLWDERMTTISAHNILHQNGKKMKKHKKNVDAVAASIILQGYLDSKRLK